MTIINLHQHKQEPLGNEIASLIDLVKEQSQVSRTLFDAQIISTLQDLMERVGKLETSRKS